MPDDVIFQSATPATPPANTRVSGEEVTTLNGGAVTAQLVQRIVHAIRTADGTAVDVTAATPLPVDDDATQAILANLLTELGQKLEPGGEVALNAATLAALETIQVGNLPADPATQTTLAAVLTELGQKLGPADLAALATAAKQDTANTSLASILTSVDGLEAKDYATQTTLAALLAKVIAAPATEAKQDTQITHLDGLEGTLSSILSDLQAKADLAETQPVSLASLPDLAATADAVTAKLATDRLQDGLTALTPKFAIIDAATSGNNTLVAAVASKKIRVHQLYLVSAGTATARFESGADGTALSGQMSLVANVGVVLPFSPVGWFETASNTLLNLELSAAVSVDGGLVYTEVT